MTNWIQQRWQRVVTPFWAAPLFIGLAIGTGLLALLLDAHAWRWDGAGLVLIASGAWLIETSGARWPRWLFVALALLPAVLLLYIGRPSGEYDTLAPLLPFLVVGWVAYVGTRREGLLTLAIASICITPPFIVYNLNRDNLVAWELALAISWLAAYAIATQRRLVRELRAAQASLARQAAAEERRRIAHEIHDVVAHSLAITMLHITGARHILARDPQRAAEALAQAEQLGRQSRNDIRRTVGLLRADRSGAAPALPGAGEIAQLVAGYAQAGMQVSCRISGDLGVLSPAAGLDLYRIAQEALANAAKHAPGACVTLELTLDEHTAQLRVSDDGARAGAASFTATEGAGLGQLGMRERTDRLGGTFLAGPCGRGWLVECRVPLTSAAVPAGLRQ